MRRRRPYEDLDQEPLDPARRVFPWTRQGPAREEVPLWVISFTDTVALLLSFFIMLFAMSAPDKDRWEQMTEAIVGRFQKDTRIRRDNDLNLREVLAPSGGGGLNLDYLVNLYRSQTAQDPILSRSVLHEMPDRLVISLPSDVLFAPGSATLNARAQRAVHGLSGFLSNLNNRVDVYGHTDPRPIRSSQGRFRSNWELSLARAVSVAQILRRSGYDQSVSVQGYADSHFPFVTRELSKNQRQTLSRRVDVVIYPRGKR